MLQRLAHAVPTPHFQRSFFLGDRDAFSGPEAAQICTESLVLVLSKAGTCTGWGPSTGSSDVLPRWVASQT